MISEAELTQAGEQLFQGRLHENYRRFDRLFGYLILGQWAFAIFLAFVISPCAWAGKTKVLHAHVLLAIFMGAGISVFPVVLSRIRPGWVVTRNVIAVALMLSSALLIHLTGGRIETHFSIFGSLAMLAFYRDWKVLIPATLVVATDHFLRQTFWPESVFGILNPTWWRFLEHAAWVVYEDVFLIYSCIVASDEMRQNAFQQVRIEKTEGMAKEMAIASDLQMALLPVDLTVQGLEISARMLPAAQVGGDYYDVIPAKQGCWIAIGDVAGHGLGAGLVMLQAQSAVGALLSQSPNASPGQILDHVNRLLFQNIRRRQHRDDHMTFSMIRYHADGSVIIAGAHEEFLVLRAKTGAVERIPVRGTWLGVIENILPATVETKVELQPGDILVLYTDGVTETRNAGGEQFGLDRLSHALAELSTEPVDQICDRILETHSKWMHAQDDDVTLMVVRHRGQAEQAAA